MLIIYKWLYNGHRNKYYSDIIDSNWHRDKFIKAKILYAYYQRSSRILEIHILKI